MCIALTAFIPCDIKYRKHFINMDYINCKKKKMTGMGKESAYKQAKANRGKKHGKENEQGKLETKENRMKCAISNFSVYFYHHS